MPISTKARADKITLFISLALFFCLTFNAAPGRAQEETTSASGTIISLDLANKTLSIEYIDENDTAVTLDLRLSEDIELFNIGSLQELKIGDDVSIDYMIDEEEEGLVGVYLYKFPPSTE